MLRGELVVEEWEASTLGLNDDADRNHVESVIAASEGALVITGQGVLQLDGAEYDVGVSTRIVHSVRLADEQPSEGIAIVPGEDNRTTFRYGAPPFEEAEDGGLIPTPAAEPLPIQATEDVPRQRRCDRP